MVMVYVWYNFIIYQCTLDIYIYIYINVHWIYIHKIYEIYTNYALCIYLSICHWICAGTQGLGGQVFQVESWFQVHPYITRQPWGAPSKQLRHWGWSLHLGLVLSQMDAVVLAVYISLSISWLLRCSGCDLWPTFRPTCAHLWEVLHVSRLICSTARWLGGFGFRGVGDVITSFPRRS